MSSELPKVSPRPHEEAQITEKEKEKSGSELAGLSAAELLLRGNLKKV
jgi:hypothetical protein